MRTYHLSVTRIFIASGSSAFLFSRIYLGVVVEHTPFAGNSHTIKGLHFACIALGGVAFSLLFRWWSRHYPRTILARMAALVMAGAFAVIAYASSPWLTLPAYFFAGGTGSMLMAMLVLIASEQAVRNELISELNIVSSLASIAAPMVIGLALAWSEWRYALLALACFLLGTYLLASRVVSEVPDRVNDMAAAVGEYRTMAWIVLMGLTMAIEWSYIFWGSAYWRSMDVGVDGSGSISIYMGAIAAGRLIYRLLQRRLSSSVVLLTSLLGHGLFLLLFLNIGALAAWLAVDVAVWVLIGALGLTIANLFPLFTVKIVEECRTERRIVASNILVVTGVIAAFLPLMFGAISDRASIHTAFSMVLAVCVVSALVVGLLLKSRPEMRPCAKLTEKTRRGARRTRYDRAQTPLKR